MLRIAYQPPPPWLAPILVRGANYNLRTPVADSLLALRLLYEPTWLQRALMAQPSSAKIRIER